MKPGPKRSIVDMACGRLTPEESLALLDDIERNPDLSAELDTAVDLVNFSSDARETIFRESKVTRESFWRKIAWWIMDQCDVRPILYPVGGLLLLLASCAVIMTANSFWIGRYDELIGIDRTVFEWNVRGPGDGEVAVAYHFFTGGDYEQSLAHLERYMRAHPEDIVEGYADYTAGVVSLLAARKSTFGLFPTTSSAVVSRGLEHLDRAARRTTNVRLMEEAHFLRAKGFLMLGQKDAALSELEAVRRMGLVRGEEAAQMTARLQVLGQ
jgi:hypothetical protein